MRILNQLSKTNRIHNEAPITKERYRAEGGVLEILVRSNTATPLQAALAGESRSLSWVFL